MPVVAHGLDCKLSCRERLNENSGLARNLFSTASEYFCDIGLTHLCIKHCIIQVVVWPVQVKVFIDERSAISIGGVDLFDCIALGHAATYQSMDFVIARSIEKCTEDILAIPKKILRAPTNDDAWAVRKRVIDRQLGNCGDATSVE